MNCLKLLSRIFVFYLDLLAKYCKTKLYQWYDLSWIDWMIAKGVILSSSTYIYAKGDFPIEYEQNMLIHAQDLSRFTLLIQQFFLSCSSKQS